MSPLVSVQIDVSAVAGSPNPCTITFAFEVGDRGDTIVDSAVLLDNLRFE